MKSIINSTASKLISDTHKQFILKCSCGGCGLLEFRKYKDGDVGIMFYSTRNLKRRDKYAWDILIDKKQASELLSNLQEMLVE